MSARAGRTTPRSAAITASARTTPARRPPPLPRPVTRRMASECHRGAVNTEDRAQAGADLPQGDLGLHGVEEPWHQVVGSAGRPLDGVKGARRPVPVPPPTEVPEPLGLPALDLGAGLEELGR